MQKRKCYNIKLPTQFRKRFSTPFDKFLTAILTYAGGLAPDIIKNCYSYFGCEKSWLLALNSEDRNEFIKCK
jgi:hypothetical protein